ncbi:spore coat protein B [Peribacillus sp. B2I2]|uniref:hypothetical protein n=1 Tax=Peribacillus sp. B2I2 TaxID=3156468 RepID=UPI0035144F00
MNKEWLTNLVGKVLKIDRGGPESRTGLLLGIYDDHLSILTEQEGVIYYKTDHIKSITENVKNGFQFQLEIPEDFTFKAADNFIDILDDLRNQWVNINRGGPEKLEGVLHDVNDEYVTLTLNEEVIRLAMFHIRSISYGARVEKPKEDEKSEKNKDNKDDGKSENNKDDGKSEKNKDNKDDGKENNKDDGKSEKNKDNKDDGKAKKNKDNKRQWKRKKKIKIIKQKKKKNSISHK